MHHNTHERRPGGFNGKDRGCSRGVGVITAGLLLKHTGRWAQRPLVEIVRTPKGKPRVPCAASATDGTSKGMLVGGGEKKGTETESAAAEQRRKKILHLYLLFLPHSALQPC